MICRYLDAHSHSLGEGKVFNYDLQKCQLKLSEQQLISVGIHPWLAEKKSFDYLFSEISFLNNKMNVCAIGETGLNKLSEVVSQNISRFFRGANC